MNLQAANISTESPVFARRLAQIQGWFFLLSGIWPLVSAATFQAVTGEKADFWLAQTVGLLLACLGFVLILAARAPAGISRELGLLAALFSGVLAIVDIYCVFLPRTTRAYWLDAVVEVGFIAGWVIVWFKQRRAEPHR